ncbi:hypothetical protein F5B20DRAFT_12558 [Whalleya microplaca]|nr:hypothetical protein F5B20DRAFT_12558 [Whalleya microplaca]
MSHPPSTPVKVPASAATYTPATLDTELRSQVNALLLREGHINKYALIHPSIHPNQPSLILPSPSPPPETPNSQLTTLPPFPHPNHHPTNQPTKQTNKLTTTPLPPNRIQDHLLHSLNAHPSNWPSSIQTHALTLLRSGEVSTFPALMRRVLEDVRRDSASSSSSSSDTNGTNGTKKGVNGTGSEPGGGGSLAVPPAVVDAVLKVARESLEAVCEVGEDGAPGGG